MKDQLEDRDCRLNRSLGNDVCIGEYHLDEIAELDPENMYLLTIRAALGILRTKKFLVGLGGEHTISLGLIRAHLETLGDFAVVQLDAHLDLRDETEYEKNHLKIGHSTVMRRVLELGCPIYQVGIRAESQEEHQFILDNGLEKNVLYAHSYAGHCGIINRIKMDNVYLTIDVDGFDPSVMPATGTPEPGGWGWQTFLHFAGDLFRRKNIIGFDVVEVAQGKNFSRGECDRTAYNAAKLIYHLLCLKLSM